MATVTHAHVEEPSLNAVINSYRWQRQGISITLNVRTDKININKASKDHIDARGARILRHRVGFNPDEVRSTIDTHHRASEQYQEPPTAYNERLRRARRRMEEKEAFTPTNNVYIHAKYRVRYYVKRLVQWLQ